MRCRCTHAPIPTRTFDGQATLWTPADTEALLIEFERLFRSRTPPQPDDVYSFHIGTRVPRSEMRTWAISTLGKEMPEEDYGFWKEVVSSATSRIMRQVVHEQSPDEMENLKRELSFWRPGKRTSR